METITSMLYITGKESVVYQDWDSVVNSFRLSTTDVGYEPLTLEPKESYVFSPVLSSSDLSFCEVS